MINETEPTSNKNEYIVQENEDLYDISMKLNLSPSRLQIINNLYPPIIKANDVLKIEDPLEITKNNHQIFVILSSNNLELPGIIVFHPESFEFIQRSLDADNKKVELSINIVSVISCEIFPHPKTPIDRAESPSEAAILILCYLGDPINPKSVIAHSFVAPRAELKVLKYHIMKKSEEKQKEVHFTKKIQSLEVAKEKEIDLEEMNRLPSKFRSSLPKLTSYFKLIGDSRIISQADIIEIRRALPFRYRCYSWKKVFSISVNGTSYSILFKETKELKCCLLFILTRKNERIGAFLSQGLHNSSESYGTGESFIFRYNPTFEIYKWSSKNQYFISSNSKNIMIGGGNGSAIWIDNNLLKGISKNCETFDSPPLVEETTFEILEMEIWTICY